MTRLRFEVSADDTAMRLDSFLALRGPLSRNAFVRLIELGCVHTQDGCPFTKKTIVRPGLVLYVDIPEATPDTLLAQDIPLHIVYEDACLLVIDKPRGLVTHPSAGHADGTLVNALLHHCGNNLSGIGGVKRPGIVHRLDKDTSGLLVAAKTDKAHKGLSEQLRRHVMARVYEALAAGVLLRDAGVADGAIGRDPKNRKRMAVVPSGGRRAVTNYRVLERLPGATHVECRLETGRTHQIRAHMRAMGHPLLGDKLYGGPDRWALGGQCLHAAQLRFFHPQTGDTMEFSCPRPDYFERVLSLLRGHCSPQA